MPIYDYACQSCGHEFERIEPIAEHDDAPPPCPTCKSTNVERVYTNVFVKTKKKS